MEERGAKPRDLITPPRGPLHNQPWHLFNASSELFGIRPLEDTLFDSSGLVRALQRAGAVVRRKVVPGSHWTMVLWIDGVIGELVQELEKKS